MWKVWNWHTITSSQLILDTKGEFVNWWSCLGFVLTVAKFVNLYYSSEYSVEISGCCQSAATGVKLVYTTSPCQIVKLWSLTLNFCVWDVLLSCLQGFGKWSRLAVWRQKRFIELRYTRNSTIRKCQSALGWKLHMSMWSISVLLVLAPGGCRRLKRARTSVSIRQLLW